MFFWTGFSCTTTYVLTIILVSQIEPQQNNRHSYFSVFKPTNYEKAILNICNKFDYASRTHKFQRKQKKKKNVVQEQSQSQQQQQSARIRLRDNLSSLFFSTTKNLFDAPTHTFTIYNEIVCVCLCVNKSL